MGTPSSEDGPVSERALFRPLQRECSVLTRYPYIYAITCTGCQPAQYRERGLHWKLTGPNPLHHRDYFCRPALRHGSLDVGFSANLQAERANSAQVVCTSQPSTLNPQPSTLHPQPCTHHPQTSSLNPQRSTLNHQPSALESQDFFDNLMVRIHFIIEVILVDRPCAMGV